MLSVKITGKMPPNGRCRGFSLIELVMVIVILGIVAAVAIPRMGGISESAKVNITRSEMMVLKKAIVGNPRAMAGGKYVDAGFEGDIGLPPDRLEDLAVKPDSLLDFNKFTGLGWNGPYIDSTADDYLSDAWGSSYVYDHNGRTIKSVGGSDTITLNF
jgi:prepilin-type N-terminal cleavage/methylation domain-containing protein